MRRLFVKTWEITVDLKIIAQGGARLALKLLVNEFLRRLYSDEQAYGFRFDLSKSFRSPQTEIPVKIREFLPADAGFLLDPARKGMSTEELRYLTICRRLLKARLPTCYVAVTQEGFPCCMCWLVRAADNHRLQECFGEGYYRMKKGEVLLENILTHPDFRRQNLMKYVIIALRKKALEMGARYTVGFVSSDNLPSLAGTKSVESKPFVIKTIRWRMFRRGISWQSHLEVHLRFQRASAHQSPRPSFPQLTTRLQIPQEEQRLRRRG